MKSRNYLIISLMLFVVLSIVFFGTKNNIYYYLTIPILIYANFMRYNREKEKLIIKTTKILIFLKYLFITTIISGILLLISAILHIKRTLLIRQELRKNNSK